jgi:ComF family protein
MGPLLGELLFDRFTTNVSADLIIPVPLHPKRLVSRGFNQATLLARVGAKKLGIPLCTKVVKRVINTPAQAGKRHNERLLSLKNAFEFNHNSSVKNKKILLIDDVVTTTATVDAVSKVLITKGEAREVNVLCLARVV